jgi:hypothetical protein
MLQWEIKAHLGNQPMSSSIRSNDVLVGAMFSKSDSNNMDDNIDLLD